MDDRRRSQSDATEFERESGDGVIAAPGALSPGSAMLRCWAERGLGVPGRVKTADAGWRDISIRTSFPAIFASLDCGSLSVFRMTP